MHARALAAWTAGGVAALAALLRLETHAVVALGVTAAMGYVAWKETGAGAAQASPAERLADAVVERRRAAQPLVSAPPLPHLVRFPKKGLRHLRLNPELLALVPRVRFVATFDRSRFEEWVLMLDQLQKVYVYILGGRYDAASYAGTFADLRDAALEAMYGFTLAVPSSFKHIYGVRPDAALAAAVDAFRAVSDRMTAVLSNYMKRELRLPHGLASPADPVPANRLAARGRENVLP